jgi:hypothetical protein
MSRSGSTIADAGSPTATRVAARSRDDIFAEPLVDLAGQDAAFTQIFTPTSALGATRVGLVDHRRHGHLRVGRSEGRMDFRRDRAVPKGIAVVPSLAA